MERKCELREGERREAKGDDQASKDLDERVVSGVDEWDGLIGVCV